MVFVYWKVKCLAFFSFYWIHVLSEFFLNSACVQLVHSSFCKYESHL